jgi:TupA-like ATPgrasp
MALGLGLARRLPKPIRQFLASRDVKNRRQLALAAARAQLTQLRAQPGGPFTRPPPPGFLRGIDFYTEDELESAVARALELSRQVIGYYPSLIDADRLNDKCYRAKFLSPLRLPESGNKLLTHTFIPRELKGRLRCPSVVWHSAIPEIPPNTAIRPGEYYLKANHGSGMFRKVRYPVQDDERILLNSLCRQWLAYDYGRDDGEWWYNAFAHEILLEEQIGSGDTSISWNVYTFGERVELIIGYRKMSESSSAQDECTWFDRNFDVVPHLEVDKPPLSCAHLSPEARRDMLEFSRAIGRNHTFLRVDYLIDDNGGLFLGEITFTPMNGLDTAKPEELDRYLASLWDQSAY